MSAYFAGVEGSCTSRRPSWRCFGSGPDSTPNVPGGRRRALGVCVLARQHYLFQTSRGWECLSHAGKAARALHCGKLPASTRTSGADPERNGHRHPNCHRHRRLVVHSAINPLHTRYPRASWEPSGSGICSLSTWEGSRSDGRTARRARTGLIQTPETTTARTAHPSRHIRASFHAMCPEGDRRACRLGRLGRVEVAAHKSVRPSGIAPTCYYISVLEP